jgi:uncharacterized protein (TIGR02145 family)
MKRLILPLIGAALFFAACGDDVTNVTEVNEKVALDIVEKYKELPKCEDSLYGTLIYAADSSQVYACTSDGWASLKGEKGDQGDDGLDGEDGKNGTNGTNGKDGEDGADGESCTATALKDGSGMEVMCGGKTVGVISNGTNGTDGEDGTNCNIVSDVDGVVTIQCGEGENAETTKLYKAMCGTDPFEPADKFCYAAELYDLCGGKVYDPSKEFCSNEVVYDLCDGNVYDPSEEFCSNEVVYYLCGGNVYDPSEEFCSNEVVYDLCGGNDYNPKKQFCAKFNDDAKTEQLYKMVTIAPEGTNYSETWMAENLNYATTNSYCYEDKEENCAKYGRLYTWTAAMEACPTGWHLPSKEEWEDLFEALGGLSTAGAKLKSQTGFSALPAGYRNTNGNYEFISLNAYFWSSSEYYDGSSAYNVHFYIGNETATLINYIKDFGFSVRCLKD